MCCLMLCYATAVHSDIHLLHQDGGFLQAKCCICSNVLLPIILQCANAQVAGAYPSSPHQ